MAKQIDRFRAPPRNGGSGGGAFDSIMYWQHPLIAALQTPEINRANQEWAHWQAAGAALAQMRDLRDFRLSLRTGLVAVAAQMAVFLGPVRGLRLATRTTVVTEEGEEEERVRRGGRWRLGLMCEERKVREVQETLDEAGFGCDVSALVAEQGTGETEGGLPFNVRYRR